MGEEMESADVKEKVMDVEIKARMTFSEFEELFPNIYAIIKSGTLKSMLTKPVKKDD